MKLLRRFNINRKILIFTNLPVLLLLLILNIALIYNERETYKVTINDYHKDMARNVSEMVSGPLFRMDYHTINDIVRTSQAYEGIIYTEVFRDGVGKIPTTEERKIQNPSQENIKYNIEDEEVYHQGKKIGRVALCFDNRPFEKLILNYTIKLAIGSLLFIILLLAVLHISILIIIIKPLSKVLETVTGISGGNLDLEVAVKSEDEIGVLALNFNKMVTKLKESIALNKAVLESMPSALIAVDEKFQVISWNSHVKKFPGLFEANSELLNSETEQAVSPYLQNMNLLQNSSIFTSMPYFMKHRKVTEHVLKTKKALKLHREAVSKEVFYQLFLFPLVDNTINGLVFRIDDVTTDELKDAQLREALKLDTLGALASGLAHDFNNVLCGIVSTVSILKFRLQNKANLSYEKIESLTNVINESAIRAEEMVKQFLGLSRKQEMNYAKVDLNASISHIAKIGRNTFDKSVTLETVLYPDKAMAIVDRTQIEQVFLNLAVNGSHAMTLMKKENWGGTLVISVEETTLTDAQKESTPTAESDSFWKISFRDHGVGMTEEIKKKIFEPFFTTKEVGKGTGLGLSMVFNIVTAHNGFVELESEFGVGSVFQVYLPKIVVDESQDDEANAAIEVQRGNEENILVVDDESVVRQTIKNIFEEANYKSTYAESGTEAIKIYEENKDKIDLVLIDYKMPNLNGLETFFSLKKINPNIRGILSSGLKEEDVLDSINHGKEQKETIESLGFKKFVQKPYTIEKLAKVINEVLHDTATGDTPAK